MKLKWNLSLTAKPAQRCAQSGGVRLWGAATRRRFPIGRHVCQFQSADTSAHAKAGHCLQAVQQATPLKARTLVPAGCTAQKDSSFDLLTARANRPIRIPPPIIKARPVLRGDKAYLRALRAAEMALWEANLKFPAF